ncbi:NAD(P)/FAD-dependent oxidoreductase [Kineosporia sp. R_H_3]|uniref:NAD(P)/FAD-dependent oxidoreductase n=1 Tax=Kineosporia sp. R_H_3 TaxID=1961848 RepID=UPI000B4B9F03|nr:NAD(P)/FAD-dependent oxidoreductase [Kineosporia sp. R_H_3]
MSPDPSNAVTPDPAAAPAAVPAATPAGGAAGPERADVVVVGAGLAGLACARVLARTGLDVAVLEAADGPGGRVRTDVVDGFRCDRGFQLLNPAYPEARRVLDLPALRLQSFPAGVVVADAAGRRLMADPRRVPPSSLLRAVSGGLRGPGSVGEKAAFARWALRCALRDPQDLLSAPDEPWGVFLDRIGVRGALRREVVDTFLAGTLAESDGSTSRRFVELLVRSFVKGSPAVPWAGMQAMPDQLAAGLPAGSVRYGVRVGAVAADGVETSHGRTTARAVVVAADPATAGALLDLPVPRVRALTTFWHVAPERPTASAALHVDGDRRGPLVNTVVMTNAAPSYSPDPLSRNGSGRALVASTVLGDAGDPATEKTLRVQLGDVYGFDTSRWELLVTHAIPQALTAMDPPLDVRRPVALGGGRFVAGDHRDSASIQGALVSGRRAANAVLEHLGLAVPPREPLDAAANATLVGMG